MFGATPLNNDRTPAVLSTISSNVNTVEMSTLEKGKSSLGNQTFKIAA